MNQILIEFYVTERVVHESKIFKVDFSNHGDQKSEKLIGNSARRALQGIKGNRDDFLFIANYLVELLLKVLLVKPMHPTFVHHFPIDNSFALSDAVL